MLKVQIVILFTIIFLLFFTKTSQFIDPDFGWHLKTGELILKSGFPKTDPFSYTMPSYHFVNHSWLADIFIAIAYPKIGISGLAIVTSLIGLLTLAVGIKMQSHIPLKYKLFLIPLTVSIMIKLISIRAQVVTWFFYALLLLIMLENHWRKFRWFLPVIFLFWSNAHAGFIGGIVLIHLYYLVKLLQRKIDIFDLPLYVVSLLSTIVGPYGTQIWITGLTIASTLSGTFLIVEWIPSIFFFDPAYITLLVLLIFLCLKQWRKFKLWEWLILIIIALQSITAIRNIAMFAVSSFLFLPRTIYHLKNDISKIPFGKQRFQIASNFILGLACCVFTIQVYAILNLDTNSGENPWSPQKAVSFLKQNPSPGNLMAPYNVGGYLIWHLPEKKTFVDGRMAEWSQQETDRESGNALLEYYKIVKGIDTINKALNKYAIDTVLLENTPEKQPLAMRLENFLDTLIIGNTPKHPQISEQLQSLGWKKVYEDKVSIIYRKI